MCLTIQIPPTVEVGKRIQCERSTVQVQPLKDRPDPVYHAVVEEEPRVLRSQEEIVAKASNIGVTIDMRAIRRLEQRVESHNIGRVDQLCDPLVRCVPLHDSRSEIAFDASWVALLSRRLIGRWQVDGEVRERSIFDATIGAIAVASN